MQNNSDKPVNNNKRRRFSLFEFVLIMGLLVMAVYVVFLKLTPALITNSQDYLKANGKWIYISCFAEIDPKPDWYWTKVGEHRKLPPSDRYPNSNVFMVDLVTNGVLDVPWRFFGGGGVKPAEGSFVNGNETSVAIFSAEHNLWSVVADLSPDDMNSPLYISRNLAEPKLIPAAEATQSPRIDSTIFKQNYVVVIWIGGAVETIPIQELTWERLNPSGLSNKILHPGDPLEEVSKYIIMAGPLSSPLTHLTIRLTFLCKKSEFI